MTALHAMSYETFPGSWGIFGTGALQHLVRVIARLHGRFEPERLESATRQWIVEQPPVPLVDYLEARERLVAFSRRVLRAWPENEVLVTPTLTRLPAPAGGLRARAGVTDDAVRFSALVRIWNVTGQPAVSLPLHETSDGVPVGVQLVGPPGGDELLLALAAQLEERTGGGRDVIRAPDQHDPPVHGRVRQVERDDGLGAVEA